MNDQHHQPQQPQQPQQPAPPQQQPQQAYPQQGYSFPMRQPSQGSQMRASYPQSYAYDQAQYYNPLQPQQAPSAGPAGAAASVASAQAVQQQQQQQPTPTPSQGQFPYPQPQPQQPQQQQQQQQFSTGMYPYSYPQGVSYFPYSVPSSQDQFKQATPLNTLRGPFQSTQPPLIDPNTVPQRPKLTTTFWEDENTVCYQVEACGVSVSRREDTNFINGTKLLNVAGMTRGRRDGILKSEKVRYVVKIGAMNLKGVWIPFERALELARNEGIVDLLYPLFVKDIKELYAGPQYSGGLTAAANENPKNIVPVMVNSSYMQGIYPQKGKKVDHSPQHHTPQTTAQPQQHELPQTQPQLPQPAVQQPPQGQEYYAYGAGYQYPQEYYNKGYYGYQPATEEQKPPEHK